MVERNEQHGKDRLDEATELLRDAHTPAGPPMSLVDSTIAAIQSQKPEPAIVRLPERRKLMFQVFRLSGIAAAVLIAIGAALVVLSDRGSGTTFADVIENVEKAKSVSFTITSEMPAGRPMEQMLYLQPGGMRMEVPGAVVLIADLQANKAVSWNHGRKDAHRWDLSPRTATGFEKQFFGIMNDFPGLRDKSAEKVREEELNGEKVDVYQVKPDAFAGVSGGPTVTIWASQKNELPVKVYVPLTGPDGKQVGSMTFDRFTWGPLDQSLFALETPEGYPVKESEPGSQEDPL